MLHITTIQGGSLAEEGGYSTKKIFTKHRRLLHQCLMAIELQWDTKVLFSILSGGSLSSALLLLSNHQGSITREHPVIQETLAGYLLQQVILDKGTASHLQWRLRQKLLSSTLFSVV